MTKAILAALAAAAILPVAAQNASSRSEPRAALPAKAASDATPREKARLAKAQNKEIRCPTGKQKKAAAT